MGAGVLSVTSDAVKVIDVPRKILVDLLKLGGGILAQKGGRKGAPPKEEVWNESIHKGTEQALGAELHVDRKAVGRRREECRRQREPVGNGPEPGVEGSSDRSDRER